MNIKEHGREKDIFGRKRLIDTDKNLFYSNYTKTWAVRTKSLTLQEQDKRRLDLEAKYYPFIGHYVKISWKWKETTRTDECFVKSGGPGGVTVTRPEDEYTTNSFTHIYFEYIISIVESSLENYNRKIADLRIKIDGS